MCIIKKFALYHMRITKFFYFFLCITVKLQYTSNECLTCRSPKKKEWSAQTKQSAVFWLINHLGLICEGGRWAWLCEVGLALVPTSICLPCCALGWVFQVIAATACRWPRAALSPGHRRPVPQQHDAEPVRNNGPDGLHHPGERQLLPAPSAPDWAGTS